MGTYYVSPEDWMAGEAETCIMDEAPSERQPFRRLRNRMVTSRTKRIIALTRKPIRDSVLALQMSPDADDLKIVKSNLYRHCGIQITDEFTSLNFHQLLVNWLSRREA